MRKEVAEAFEAKRQESEQNNTAAVLALLRVQGVKAAETIIRDADDVTHSAIILTSDQYAAMMDLLRKAAFSNLTQFS